MSSPKDVYVALASIPVYTSAQFESANVIRVTSSTRDHIRNTKRSSTKTLVVPSSANGEVVSTSSQDVSPEVVASTTSPSGNLTAILRETGQGEKKRFVEIWAKDRLIVATEVTKLHGVFYTDDYLHSLSFSPSETKLVYTAEANTTENQEDPYARFRFVPDFGESLTERKRPQLALFHWQSESTTSFGQGTGQVDIISFPPHLQVPSAVLFGQAVFATEDRIFATGYEYTNDGHLLGVKGCWNRPSSVWELQLQLSAEGPSETDTPASPVCVLSSSKISDPARSARSPCISKDQDSSKTALFWLSNQLGGPHTSCTSLHSLDLDTQESKTLLGTIDQPSPSVMDDFAGLYTEFALPAKPFLRLGKNPKTYIVTQTAEGSRTTIVLIDAESPLNVKRVTSAKNDSAEDALFSWNFLGTDGHAQFLCARSSSTRPNELLLGTVDDQLTVTWKVLDVPVLPPAVEQALKSLQVSIIQIPNRHPVETILVKESKGSSAELKPLATFIHGGPHSTSFTAFTPSVAALALQGYNVSLPNYTGSLGFGEYYVQKLLGRCGSLDVEDTLASVQHLIKLGFAEDKPEKLFLLGGSHGGFLGAHLVGQYPDKFGAAVLRNPVITGASPASTDIPDWYFWEFGIPYTPGADITPELYEKLWKMSPIAHVDKVKAPVLLHLGTSDRRVINVQGRDYYHALKGRGKTVEMMEFKGEGHPLDGVEAARVTWETTVDWFEKVRS